MPIAKLPKCSPDIASLTYMLQLVAYYSQLNDKLPQKVYKSKFEDRIGLKL